MNARARRKEIIERLTTAGARFRARDAHLGAQINSDDRSEAQRLIAALERNVDNYKNEVFATLIDYSATPLSDDDADQAA